MSTMSTVERGNEVAVGALVVRNLEWVLVNQLLVTSTTHLALVPSTLYPEEFRVGACTSTTQSVQYTGY